MGIIRFARLWASTLRELRRSRAQWVAGYRQALDTHRLEPDDADLTALRERGGDRDAADLNWVEGYRACLTAHGLAETEADRRLLATHGRGSEDKQERK